MADSTEPTDNDKKNLPEAGKGANYGRGALQIAGAVPGVGGIFSLIASKWSEKEQDRINEFFVLGFRCLKMSSKKSKQQLLR